MNTIAHNISAMNAQRQFGINSRAKAKSIEKLSSGFRINRAADDAAGLAISEKMRSQIRGLSQGTRNVQDGISLLQVADGALSEVSEMLHRIKELSVQAANGTNTDTDREFIEDEVFLLLEAIDEISEDTEFNTIHIFKEQSPLSLQNSDGFTDNFNNTTTPLPPSVPTYTTITRNYNLTGKPIDTSITQYTIMADESNGVTVNGDAVAWSEIINTNGTNLAEQNIEAGTYTFQYNGLTVSFDVADIDTKESIVNALNGLSFEMNYTPAKVNAINSMSFKLYTPTESANITRDEFNSLIRQSPHTLYADETGVQLDASGTKRSWNDIFTQAGLTEETAMKNGGTINLGKRGEYDIVVSFKSGASISDLVNEINGISFEINGSVSDSTVISAYNPCNTAITATCDYFYLTQAFTEMLGYDVLYGENTMKALYSASGLSDEYPHSTYLFFMHNSDVVSTTKNAYLTLSKASLNALDEVFKTGVTTKAGSITLDFVSPSYPVSPTYGNSNVRITWNYPAGINERDLWNAVGSSSPSPLFGADALEMKIATSYTTKGLQANKIDTPESIQFDIDDSYVNNDVENTPQVPTPTPTPPSTDNKENAVDLIEALNLWIQSGANEGQGMWLTIDNMSTSILGLADVDVSTVDGATNAIISVKEALAKVTKNRSKIGAQQNRLEHTFAREEIAVENLSASESRIRDADMALEMTEYAKINILEQVSQSMMAQANQNERRVLDLLSM